MVPAKTPKPKPSEFSNVFAHFLELRPPWTVTVLLFAHLAGLPGGWEGCTGTHLAPPSESPHGRFPGILVTSPSGEEKEESVGTWGGGITGTLATLPFVLGRDIQDAFCPHPNALFCIFSICCSWEEAVSGFRRGPAFWLFLFIPHLSLCLASLPTNAISGLTPPQPLPASPPTPAPGLII